MEAEASFQVCGRKMRVLGGFLQWRLAGGCCEQEKEMEGK